MGTLIKSIAFENFYNYYGSYKDNLYEFTEGINIINADNNMGKSKFYNGFLWLLKDKVYDSDDKKFWDASASYERMASAKAKREEDSFVMGVRIIYKNDGFTYTVEKCVRFEKEEFIWKTIPKLLVSRLDENGDLPILDVNEQQEIIRRLIPVDMEKYAMLQGESMETIVDLSTKDGLNETITQLADISNVIEMCTLASNLAGRALRDAREVERKNTKAGTDLAEKQAKRDQYQTWIDETNIKLTQARTELNEARIVKEECGKEIASTSKRAKLRTEYDKEVEIYENMQNEKTANALSVTRRLFDENSPWVLLGLKEEIDNFDDNRLAYQNARRDSEIRNNPEILLPAGSPDALSLERMLNTMVCEVCGRSLKDDPEAYNHVKKILERPIHPMHSTQDSLYEFFSGLQTSAGGYVRTIPLINEQFEKFLDAIDDLDDKIEAQSRLVENKLNELMAYGVREHTEDEDTITLHKYTQATNKIRELEGDIRDFSGKIQMWSQLRDKLIKEINEQQESSEVEEAKEFAEKIRKISQLFEATKDRVFNQIVDRLQDEANSMYSRLTEGNQTKGGTLRFDRQNDGTVRVRVIASSGEELTGNGTGFQRMKQLAIVMSIISSKIGNKHFNYPFISDAPFSEFSFNFINNFFNIAPNVFTQSIIMIKDLYDPKRQNFITPDGEKILNRMNNEEMKGTFYVNYMESRNDASDMVTKKLCYTNRK